MLSWKQIVAALLLPAGALTQQSEWGQCGGPTYTGPSSCPTADECIAINSFYSQCVPLTAISSGSVAAADISYETTVVRLTVTEQTTVPTTIVTTETLTSVKSIAKSTTLTETITELIAVTVNPPTETITVTQVVTTHSTTGQVTVVVTETVTVG